MEGRGARAVTSLAFRWDLGDARTADAAGAAIAGHRLLAVGAAGIAALATLTQHGGIAHCAESAPRGGVAGMMLLARRALARDGIHVVAIIAPGLFGAPMMAASSKHVRASLDAAMTRRERIGDAVDYASCVLPFAADAHLDGTIIRLDAGLRMGA